MVRIAHVSDPHVLTRTAAQWRSIVFNKRLTGYANLVLRRGRVHRRDYLVSVLEAAAGQCDHLVVTGDITNLSLEHEYEEARGLLVQVAQRTEITVVPGNHDIYLPSIKKNGRFAGHFSEFMRSDLPELACDVPAGRFPVVKLRGAVAFIGLSSAVPRPPFVAAGHIGRPQLDALERVLAHPAVRHRTPVILIHHPAWDTRPRLVQLRDGLVDATALRATLRQVAYAIVLFGHLHVRRRYTLHTASGTLEGICAGGAALNHPGADMRAGFNRYVIDEGGGLQSVEAWVVDRDGAGFEKRTIDQVVVCEERP